MWRSEPHTPVASTRTIASSRSISSGCGRSSIATSPGAWNVTACMGEGRYSLAALTDAFYDLTRERAVRASTRSPGDLARPTELTRGPWDANAQHAGPPSALLARAIERCEPRERARIGRITVEILVRIPIQPLTVSARVARPGRSVEMLEASLEGPDGEVMRARGWRLAEADITADWEQDEPPPGREHAEALEFFPDNEGLARTARSRVRRERAARLVGPHLHQHRPDRAHASPARGGVGVPRFGDARRRPGHHGHRPVGRARANRPGRTDLAGAGAGIDFRPWLTSKTRTRSTGTSAGCSSSWPRTRSSPPSSARPTRSSSTSTAIPSRRSP